MYELNFSFEIVGFQCDTFWCDIDVTNDNWTLPQHFFVFIYIDVEKKERTYKHNAQMTNKPISKPTMHHSTRILECVKGISFRTNVKLQYIYDLTNRCFALK